MNDELSEGDGRRSAQHLSCSAELRLIALEYTAQRCSSARSAPNRVGIPTHLNSKSTNELAQT
jgi:hypothetical protein